MKFFKASGYVVFAWFVLQAGMPGVFAGEAGYGRYAPSRFSNQVVLVDWNGTEGRARLQRADNAGTANDFFQMAHHFQPQINLLYCGIASSVIVLNALRAWRGGIPSHANNEIAISESFGGGRIPYPLYSQAGFLNAATDKIKSREIIEFRSATVTGKPDPGLMLHELGGVLEAHGARVQVRHADLDEIRGVEAMRVEFVEVFSDTTRFVIANYDSRVVGQAGYGHIAPLAAYDAQTDSALLMDVSGHLNPWVWIPLRELYLAMHTLDGTRYRGYVVVEDRLPE